MFNDELSHFYSSVDLIFYFIILYIKLILLSIKLSEKLNIWEISGFEN